MEIIDHGLFTTYMPVLPDEHPAKDDNRILFCRNQDNLDWYLLLSFLTPGAALVEIDPITDRVYGLTGGTHDYTHRFPAGKRLLEVRPASAVDGVQPGWAYRDGGFHDDPPPVPDVSAAAARIALLQAPSTVPEADNMLDLVEWIVMQYPREVQIWFESAQVWERYNPYVMGLAAELGMTDEEVDELFMKASKLS